MPHTSSLSAYDDIKAVIDSALEAGLPMVYHVPGETLTPQGLGRAAVRWRSRFYHFRNRTSIAEYKDLVLRIEPSAPHDVIIEREARGELRKPDGSTVPVREPKPDLTEEEAAAQDLAKELGIKV